MKKVILTLFLLYCNSTFSQTLPNLDEIKLDHAADYKTTEPIVIQTATYILSIPVEKANKNRLAALSFIIKWMSGTPDYSFTLDNITGKVTKGNDDLLGIYMACLAKYCLENKSSAKDEKLVKLNSVKMLLTYCQDSKNNIKLTKQLKKLSEANQKGELEKEL